MRFTRKLHLAALLAITVVTPDLAVAEVRAPFVSQTPTARVDYWQVRAADISRQLSSTPDLESVRIVFVGDSITDFWHLDANPWFPGKYCGRTVWDESFGSGSPCVSSAAGRVTQQS